MQAAFLGFSFVEMHTLVSQKFAAFLWIPGGYRRPFSKYQAVEQRVCRSCPRFAESGRMNLCFIRQFDNLLKGVGIADSQTFIEGRPYQLFMVVGEKVVGLVMIAVKEGRFAKM